MSIQNSLCGQGIPVNRILIPFRKYEGFYVSILNRTVPYLAFVPDVDGEVVVRSCFDRPLLNRIERLLLYGPNIIDEGILGNSP